MLQTEKRSRKRIKTIYIAKILIRKTDKVFKSNPFIRLDKTSRRYSRKNICWVQRRISDLYGLCPPEYDDEILKTLSNNICYRCCYNNRVNE